MKNPNITKLVNAHRLANKFSFKRKSISFDSSTSYKYFDGNGQFHIEYFNV